MVSKGLINVCSLQGARDEGEADGGAGATLQGEREGHEGEGVPREAEEGAVGERTEGERPEREGTTVRVAGVTSNFRETGDLLLHPLAIENPALHQPLTHNVY